MKNGEPAANDLFSLYSIDSLHSLKGYCTLKCGTKDFKISTRTNIFL